MLGRWIPSWIGLQVLDVGCGEGKNAVHMAEKGASVCAVDISEIAIRNAMAAWPDARNIAWKIQDVRNADFDRGAYDVVIAYGLLHCLSGIDEIRDAAHRLKSAVKMEGFCVVCSFNDRSQDLSAHPGFEPCLIDHQSYLALFREWPVVYATDSDLTESHPHNGIVHTHSMTRLIVRKRGV